MAAVEACGRSRDRVQLHGLFASWGLGDVTSEESGGANPARHDGSNRALLVGDSRGAEWHPQQNADSRRFSDPGQARPVVDGPTLVANRPRSALLIPVSQSEMAHEVKMIFEELGCSQLAVVAYSRRNPATRSLAQFVECIQIPKSVNTPECNAIGGAQTGRRQSQAPPCRPWADGVSLGWASMLRRDWEYSGVCEPGHQTSRCTS